MSLSRMYRSTIAFFLGVLFIGPGGAKRILIMTPLFSGQLSEAAGICDALVKGGHDVYVVTDANNKYPSQIKYVKNLKYLHYKSPNPELADFKKFDRKLSELLFEGKDQMTILKSVGIKAMKYFSECLLNDTALLDNIKQLKFEFAIFDSFLPVLGVIPYLADIPYASWSPLLTPFRLNLSPFNAFEPCNLFGESNTIINRMKQIYIAIFFQNIPYHITDGAAIENWINTHHPDHKIKALKDIVAKSLFFIVTTNNLLDCPTSSNPDIVQAGGLSAHPAEPLSGELEKFVSSTQDGVIVFTLGSTMSTLPTYVIDKFNVAFQKLKQKVVWRLQLKEDQTAIEFPPNVKIMSWLPQNDLLGHPNTKVFITHCGANGQTEALYHGVPILGAPLHADQIYNAKKFQLRGYGLEMKLMDFTADEVYQKLSELLSNTEYRDNIKKSSRIFRTTELPSVRVRELVEHVLEFGADHLKTAASEMEWYQFYMVDIFAIVFTAITVALYICLKITKKIIAVIFKPKKKKVPTATLR